MLVEPFALTLYRSAAAIDGSITVDGIPFTITVLGLALPLSVGFLTPYSILISPWSAVMPLGTSVLRASPSAPFRAARLDPVEILKYE